MLSASANTPGVLARAGLAALVDVSIDGNAIVAEGLRARPAPDMLLAACRELGVEPARTVVFETHATGVEAARAAGFLSVVGVDGTAPPKRLLDRGAARVVAGLGEVLGREVAVAR